jgi:hypothetical protein
MRALRMVIQSVTAPQIGKKKEGTYENFLRIYSGLAIAGAIIFFNIFMVNSRQHSEPIPRRQLGMP